MIDDKYIQEITEVNGMMPIANMIYDLSRRANQLEYALLLMVYQYCTDGNALNHSFMCAGETAFRVLGITLKTPVTEIEERMEQLEREGY